MQTISSLRTIAVMALLIGSGIAASAQTASLNTSKLQVRLWYQETGRFSDNIAPPAEVILWNTIIGEGSAEEIADDVLFTAQVVTVGEENVTQPLLLTATDAFGRVLAQRRFDHILTSVAGYAVLPLWVEDIGCAGTVIFSARFGAESHSFPLQFACGE